MIGLDLLPTKSPAPAATAVDPIRLLADLLHVIRHGGANAEIDRLVGVKREADAATAAAKRERAATEEHAEAVRGRLADEAETHRQRLDREISNYQETKAQQEADIAGEKKRLAELVAQAEADRAVAARIRADFENRLRIVSGQAA
jgi:hypothetical protein